MKLLTLWVLALGLTLFSASCNLLEDNEITDFQMLTNFRFPGDTLVLEMDLTNAPFGGVCLPSPFGKDGDRQFHFSFTAKRSGWGSGRLAYKIYYQNESYKHPEVISQDSLVYNVRSRDNFYGSWISDTLIGFKTTEPLGWGETVQVIDSFFIAGNPFNHERFYGVYDTPYYFTEERVKNMMELIRPDTSWMAMIEDKAQKDGREIEEQLRIDAIWTLESKHQQKAMNQRYRNNPRVGSYRFMLVVGNEDAIKQLSDSIVNPLELKKFGSRLNPFYYFQYGAGADTRGIAMKSSDKILKTYAVLRPQQGVYYAHYDFSQPLSPELEGRCAHDSVAFHNAHFRQYLNTVYTDLSLNNVISTADIGGTDYSRSDYESSMNNTLRDSTSYVSKPEAPCINATYSPKDGAIVLTNPGNAQPPYVKENAGTVGRVGFAYGKFRARIRFPEILSNDNVWNGITCAYWLKMSSLEDWNVRDTCYSEGYLSKDSKAGDGIRVPVSPYSEIDIEIVKTSRHWPKTSYTNPDTVNYYNPSNDHNLIVTCTNWDLACTDPVNYGIGVQRITRGNKTHFPHRWDTWYQALTLKSERPHNETVGDVLLYEIDWRPDEIIWRIGPDTGQMSEVGYMNDGITKIPNNQMVPVISQEFHYGDWWPTTPFHQSNLPYPKNPITGMVYEIVIE